MRDRLVELTKASLIRHIDKSCKLAENITDDLLASGVIVPPYKVGQTVYVLTTDSPTGIEETKISQVVVRVKGNGGMSYSIAAPCVFDDLGDAKWSFCWSFFENDFNKTVFLTKEQAEKALAERSKNDRT